MQRTTNAKNAQLQNAQCYKTPNATNCPKLKKNAQIPKNNKNPLKKNIKIFGVKSSVYYFRARVGLVSFIAVIFFLQVCHANVVITPVFSNCCRQKKYF